jgi:hypothetical protein
VLLAFDRQDAVCKRQVQLLRVDTRKLGSQLISPVGFHEIDGRHAARKGGRKTRECAVKETGAKIVEDTTNLGAQALERRPAFRSMPYALLLFVTMTARGRSSVSALSKSSISDAELLKAAPFDRSLTSIKLASCRSSQAIEILALLVMNATKDSFQAGRT